MLTTLNEAANSALRNIAGACPLSPEFIQLVNDATRMIMRRGDWPGTIVPIRVCVRNGYLTWPRYVGTVRKLNVFNQNVEVRNMWGDFLPYVQPQWRTSPWWGGQEWGQYCGQAMDPGALTCQGKAPWLQDILGEGRFVRVYATAAADRGKRVTIFGKDNNGQTLRTQNSDGTWSDGWVITIQSPFGSTAGYVRTIERILLDVMESDVRLYGYNADTDLLEDIGTYEPGDTNPAFERHRLNSYSRPGCCVLNVAALVKLKFVPARFPNDLVLVDNLDALKMMIQSIKFREAGDFSGSRESELACMRELNLDLDDVSPANQIVVSDQAFSGAGVGQPKMF